MRQLTVVELNRQRRQAVRLRLEGQTLAQVAQATGLSTPTIIAAVKAFKQAGWAAVTVLVVITFNFLLFRVLPGDPAQVMAVARASTCSTINGEPSAFCLP